MHASRARFEADLGGPQPANVIRSYDVDPGEPSRQIFVGITIERPGGSLQITDEVWDYMLNQAEINQYMQSREDSI